MDAVSLLPRNRTAFERALSLTTDAGPRLADGVNAIIGAKYLTPRSATLTPFLIVEYGLGEVSAYVSSALDLISVGVHWQRLRGTVSAIAMGLTWLGYTATLEEATVRRSRWNLFQLHLDRVRDAETPDLDRIEGVVGLSVPLRSKFFRGFSGYDVRATETSCTKTSKSLLATMSGVRIRNDGTLWSFGRNHDYDDQLTQAELMSAGVWIPSSANPFAWAAATFPWSLATFAWNTPVDRVRKGLMAAQLTLLTCWAEFRNSAGNVIGYRRCRAVCQVASSSPVDNSYKVGSNSFVTASRTSALLYVEALTNFGEGFGSVAASVGLRFGASPVSPLGAGALWAQPGQLNLPVPAIAVRSVSIPFGLTVRERVRTLLRITA